MSVMDGLLNLLSLASLNFLGNVLDFRTYSAPNQGEDEAATSEQILLLNKYDCCHISGDERASICYARGIAVAIFNWIRSTCTVTDPDGNTVEDIPSYFVCRVLKALLRYKACAMRHHLAGAPHCDTAALKKQIENVVKVDGPIAKFWANKGDLPDDSLGFGQAAGYTVVQATFPVEHCELEPSTKRPQLIYPLQYLRRCCSRWEPQALIPDGRLGRKFVCSRRLNWRKQAVAR